MEMKFHNALLIDGKFFSRGVQNVPEKIQSHAHFQNYMKLGWITDPSEASKPQETLEERNLRLAAKIGVQPKAEPIEVESLDGDEAQSESEEKAQSKKSKFKKR
jgi:hypothetical protein